MVCTPCVVAWQVSVFDANPIRKNTLIGEYSFDLLNVYYQEHHEVNVPVKLVDCSTGSGCRAIASNLLRIACTLADVPPMGWNRGSTKRERQGHSRVSEAQRHRAGTG